MSRSEVEAALRCVLDLDDSQAHDDFDLFLAWPIDDDYLESIRKRCWQIVRECPPQKPGEDISDMGKDRLGAILHELQAGR